MKINLCIPAYNEAPILEETLQTVCAALPRDADLAWHIIVVDNASTDGTADVVRALALPEVSVLTIPTRGKGAAIVAGAHAAHAADADIFGFIDADLSAHPRHIAELLAAVAGGSDLAVGSRLHAASRVDRNKLRTLSSVIFNRIRKSILHIRVADTQCGLKFANRRGYVLLMRCVEHGWFFDIEWLAQAEAGQLSIQEIPISWEEHYFPNRKSKLKLVRDTCSALATLARIRYRLIVNHYGA